MQTKSKRERDQDLDKALKESFPASDALSTNEPDDPPIRPIGRKPPRFDFGLINRLAKKVARRARREGK